MCSSKWPVLTYVQLDLCPRACRVAIAVQRERIDPSPDEMADEVRQAHFRDAMHPRQAIPVGNTVVELHKLIDRRAAHLHSVRILGGDAMFCIELSSLETHRT